MPSAFKYPSLTRQFSSLIFSNKSANAARHRRIRHDLIPMGGPREAHWRRGSIHLLIRPECPAHVVALQHGAELRDPGILVLAGFAHPDGRLIALTEIQVGLDHILGGRGPVFVEGVDRVRVDGRPEYREVTVPLRAAQDDSVVLIHLSNGLRDPAV